jgi:hypothetical protein
MVEPFDKHPEDPKEAAKADREMDGNVMAGLRASIVDGDGKATAPSVTRCDRY